MASSLFPRWSNTVIRWVFVLSATGIAAAIAAPLIYARTPFSTGQTFTPDQPVQFDHRHHVRDDGIDCEYCHSTVRKAAAAGVPSTEVCVGCHSQIWNDSPMLEPVRRSYFSAAPIPWNRVHSLPDFVYFNHAIHVTKGVGCVTCHGRVDLMALATQATPMTMGWCLDCHRDPTPNLRPQSAITQMDWKPDGDSSALTTRLGREYGTRSLTSCSTCHR